MKKGVWNEAWRIKVGMRKALGFCTESKTSEKNDKIMDSLSLESLLNQSVAFFRSRINWLTIGIPWSQEALRIIEGHLKQCDFTSCLQTPATKQGKSGASSCLSHFLAARCAKRKYLSSDTGKPRNRNRWVKCTTRGLETDSLKRDGARERPRR